MSKFSVTATASRELRGLPAEIILPTRLARAAPSRATDSGIGATRPADRFLLCESLCCGQQLLRLFGRRNFLLANKHGCASDLLVEPKARSEYSSASMTTPGKVIAGGEKHLSRFAFCPAYDFICWAIIGWVAQHMVRIQAKNSHLLIPRRRGRSACRRCPCVHFGFFGACRCACLRVYLSACALNIFAKSAQL